MNLTAKLDALTNAEGYLSLSALTNVLVGVAFIGKNFAPLIGFILTLVGIVAFVSAVTNASNKKILLNDILEVNPAEPSLSQLKHQLNPYFQPTNHPIAQIKEQASKQYPKDPETTEGDIIAGCDHCGVGTSHEFDGKTVGKCKICGGDYVE